MTGPRIGVDVGGTKILAGAVDASGRVVARSLSATPRSAEALCEAVAGAVAALGTPGGEPVGVAVAGRVDAAGRRLVQAANLGLADVPLAELIERRAGAPVRLVNDADAAMWAECRFGAARDCTDAVMVTVGTGVGGSAVAGGALVTGAHGGAGEIGHMVVKWHGRACTCGGRGCLDQYGSGRALWRYARKAHGGPHSALAADLGAAADAGAPYALEAFDRVAGWLGAGIANVVALLDPERVVLAGGVAASTPVLTDGVRRHLHDELRRRGVTAAPAVSRALLGADAGMIGAAQLSPGEDARRDAA